MYWYSGCDFLVIECGEDQVISTLRKPTSAFACLLLSLVGASCSRPVLDPGSAEASPRQAPFRDGIESVGASPDLIPSINNRTNDLRRAPFHDPQSLPAGTLLSVRLNNPVSSDNSGASVIFSALVDEAIVLDGTTLVPRGASVEGRIESAQSSIGKQNRGFVRLTLDLVGIDGHDLPIRTSSLFVRGRCRELQHAEGSRVVTIEQGRRLTFRLTEPAYVVSQPALSRR
jgi:hypothetical protein